MSRSRHSPHRDPGHGEGRPTLAAARGGRRGSARRTRAQVAEGLTSKTQGGETLRVREVWRDNLDEEMDVIRGVVDDYPFIAMDTEFPGVVARPVGQFKNSGEYHYQTLRRALAQQLSDSAAGAASRGCCCWSLVEVVFWLTQTLSGRSAGLALDRA
jgi:hypothetical protein